MYICFFFLLGRDIGQNHHLLIHDYYILHAVGWRVKSKNITYYIWNSIPLVVLCDLLYVSLWLFGNWVFFCGGGGGGTSPNSELWTQRHQPPPSQPLCAHITYIKLLLCSKSLFLFYLLCGIRRRRRDITTTSWSALIAAEPGSWYVNGQPDDKYTHIDRRSGMCCVYVYIHVCAPCLNTCGWWKRSWNNNTHWRRLKNKIK